MFQSFDYFGKHEIPNIILCNPNKKKIDFLNCGYNKNLTLRFNQLSEFSMEIPLYINGEKIEVYDNIVSKKLILIENIGYFIIADVSENNDGVERTKEIKAYSLETELSSKKINIFDGTYKFYDPLNVSNTLMGKILLNSGWSIGQIDSDLWNIYRTFEIPDSNIYEFLIGDVENSYECVFVFDSFAKTVSAYTLKNLIKNTDIFLSYHNLIRQVTIEQKSDEIVTALSAYGGNGLGISTVNPLGTNTLYNFDYYKSLDWMEQSLIDAINNWEQKITNNTALYSSTLLDLKNKNILLTSQKSILENLKANRDSIEGVIKVMIDGGQQNTPEYTAKVNELNAAVSAVSAQERLIADTQLSITTLTSNLNTINQSLSFESNFTAEQIKELNLYMIENTYQNDSFSITSTMNPEDIQDMSQQLFNTASNLLERLSQPRYLFSMNSVNFLYLEEFKPFTDQLELGCLINIEVDLGKRVSVILLEMNYSLDDPETFNLTFGNRYRLDSAEYVFKDLFGDAIKAGSTVKFDAGKWGEYVNSGMNNTVSDFINNALDCAKNNVINATNQEIVINQNGLRGRNLTDTGDYSPNQVWLTSNTLAFTKNGWNTAGLALGQIDLNGQKVFGLVADAIVGKLIAGNQLQISNDNNNFVLDSNGAVLTNAYFTVVSKDNKSQILLNPDYGISIQTRPNQNTGWTNKFYTDTNGNLIMNGTLTAQAGNIGGWQIASDRLYNTANGDYIGSNGYGKLSLLNWSPSSATFNGNIYANNLQGQIGTGQVQNGAITPEKLDTLYATRAFVDEINAEVARVNSLSVSNTAQINNLQANKASIGQLNAVAAQIDNLMAGQVKATFLNSIRGQFDQLIYGGYMMGTYRANVRLANGSTQTIYYYGYIPV